MLGKTVLPITTAAAIIVAACSGQVESAATTTSETEATAGGDGVASQTDVTLATEDGLVLEATVYPGSTSWVVLGHMLPADKDSWRSLAAALQRRGYSVLAYNNRGYGNSGGGRQPYALLTDAEAALSFAADSGAQSIVYGGASMNGAAALVLGAEHDLAGIFTLSAVPSFPGVEDAISSVPDIAEPKLFVAAEDDGDAADDARDYFDHASDPRQMIILEQGGHGTRLLSADPTLIVQIADWAERLFDG